MLDAPLRWLAIVTAALALAVSGLFGGLRPAPAPASVTPTLAPSAVSTGLPWNVTVNAVRLFDDLSPLVLENEGDRWLAVVVTIEITADASMNTFVRALRIHGAEGLLTEEPAQVRLASDASIAGYLHPGVPERLGFFWEQRADAPVPQRLTVEIFGRKHIISTITHLPYWLEDTDPRAVVTVPVDDRRSPSARPS
jgi:hypothetical protein